MIKKPFIHLFSTKNHRYAYDVNSNDIIRLSEISYDYLTFLCSGLDDNSSRTILEQEYSVNDCKKTINYINEMIENKIYFSEYHPEKISMFCCDKEMKHYYDNYISHLTLEVTQQCNLNCSYCTYNGMYENERRKNNTFMSWETAKKGIDFLFKHGGVSPFESVHKKTIESRINNSKESIALAFYGGEPLLNFDLIKKCVDYVKSNKPKNKNFRYSITTNATLLDEYKIKFLLENKFNITLSLDGPQNIHDFYRKNSNDLGTHKDVINAINNINKYAKQNAKNEKYKILINSVFVGNMNAKETFAYFISMEDLLNNQYIETHFFFNTINGGVKKWNSYNKDNILKPVEGFDELIEEYKTECIKGTFCNGKKLSFRLTALQDICAPSFFFDLHGRTRNQLSDEYQLDSVMHPGSICKFATRRPLLTANGEFLPCERVPSNDPYFCVGNIDTGFDLEKIKSLFNDFTDATSEECKNCWCLRICKVGCIHSMVKNGKFDIDSKKYSCLNLRENRHQELIHFMTLLEEHPNALDHYNDFQVA